MTIEKRALLGILKTEEDIRANEASVNFMSLEAG